MSQEFSDAWLDDRFDRAVKPDLFEGRAPEERPVLVMLGGQPGAGKTRGADLAQQGQQVPLVTIDGDAFREIHPDYARLQRDDPTRMPEATAAVSGAMVKRSLDYAIENRVSVLLEGTFRDPELVMATANRFHEAGFDVNAVAMAVPPEVSLASTIGRYEETLGTPDSRWTPPQAHEAALEGMPKTVEALGGSPAVNQLTIVDRSGHVLQDSSVAGPERAATMRACIEEAHSRPLTQSEREGVAKIEARAEQQGIANLESSAVTTARSAFGAPASEATKPPTTTPQPAARRPLPGPTTTRAPGIGR